jgi:hypothetical protein
MSKKVLCLTIAVAVAVASLMALPLSAGPMRAGIVTGHVAVNGIALDSLSAAYPLLRLRGMYYFPMTYHLARLLGLRTYFSPAQGLSVVRVGGVGEFVPDEGSMNRLPSVPVTAPTFPVVLNGRRVDTAAEAWPLLCYGGVTYFPLTERFTREFGWTVAGESSTKLTIDSVPGAKDREADVIGILNRTYFVPRRYLGVLHELATGASAHFAAETQVRHFTGRGGREPDATWVSLSVSPFEFGDIAWPHDAVLAARVEAGRDAGLPLVHARAFTPTFAASEVGYILRSFMRLRFVGEERKRILALARVAAQGNFETWEMTAHLPDDGFFARPRIFVFRITFVVDTERGVVVSTVLENNRYRLRLSAQD